jgi:hypothetical protein
LDAAPECKYLKQPLQPKPRPSGRRSAQVDQKLEIHRAENGISEQLFFIYTKKDSFKPEKS